MKEILLGDTDVGKLVKMLIVHMRMESCYP